MKNKLLFMILATTTTIIPLFHYFTQEKYLIKSVFLRLPYVNNYFEETNITRPLMSYDETQNILIGIKNSDVLTNGKIHEVFYIERTHILYFQVSGKNEVKINEAQKEVLNILDQILKKHFIWFLEANKLNISTLEPQIAGLKNAHDKEENDVIKERFQNQIFKTKTKIIQMNSTLGSKYIPFEVVHEAISNKSFVSLSLPKAIELSVIILLLNFLIYFVYIKSCKK